MDGFFRDLRHAIRNLLRSPIFAIVTVLTLTATDRPRQVVAIQASSDLFTLGVARCLAGRSTMRRRGHGVRWSPPVLYGDRTSTRDRHPHGARGGSSVGDADGPAAGSGLTAVGVASGLAIAFATNRVMRSLLFGVKPTDPLTIAGVVSLMGLVAFVACLLPAHTATRVDPMIVLRDE